jgi:hypothetical protein
MALFISSINLGEYGVMKLLWAALAFAFFMTGRPVIADEGVAPCQAEAKDAMAVRSQAAYNKFWACMSRADDEQDRFEACLRHPPATTDGNATRVCSALSRQR